MSPVRRSKPAVCCKWKFYTLKEIAIYGGSESCVHIRKDVGEALTGGCAGQPLSREIHAPCREVRVDWGAEAVGECRRPHRGNRFGEVALDPTRSETLCTHTNTLFGNRDIPSSSVVCWEATSTERIEKPMGVQR